MASSQEKDPLSGEPPASKAPLTKQYDADLDAQSLKRIEQLERQVKTKDNALKAREKEVLQREFELQLVKQELKQANDISFIQFLLGLLSSLLVGFGVNLATSNSPNSAGWFLIVAAILIQCVSFIMRSRARTKKSNP